MPQHFRLNDGGHIDRSKAISFTFNGVRYQGFQGDTLASALLANGVHFVARSWKYHRPRGILTAGVEEPNAIVQLESGKHTVPNARATEVEIYQDLSAVSVNALPSLENDRLAINQKIARFIPAGFYYKTFMWPRRFWPKYEKLIRAAAGLGSAPTTRDPSRYDKRFAHCDVLIVGGGPACLIAALTAGRAGVRVILVDDQPLLGGSFLASREKLDGQPAYAWVRIVTAELRGMANVTVLSRSTAFGYQDHNLVTVTERLTDHKPLAQRTGTREMLWKVRARRVVLATGAHERPLVFGNNDLPGVMLASAVTTYIRRYGVLPGKRAVIFTNNNSAYEAALALSQAGAMVTVVDSRQRDHVARIPAFGRLNVTVIHGSAVHEARGNKRVSSVRIGAYLPGRSDVELKSIDCDLLAISGGFSPALHLFAHSGGRAKWDDNSACFITGSDKQATISAGSSRGTFNTRDVLTEGHQAANACLKAFGSIEQTVFIPLVEDTTAFAIQPLWIVGSRERSTHGAKQFVDFQNDVAATDIYLAAREGFESIEHVKRYTAMGFGTDQGKTGNVNGMAILAEALGKTIPETGTTTFRPNYTPVTFGAFVGREIGAKMFEPVRKTCFHQWHEDHGAVFEDVGQWKRPWYYPRDGEDLHAAVHRECLAVRKGVAVMDASTLGKIDIQGPDAKEFLNWVYTNAWSKLEVGKARYGLMLNENGMVFDDGVTVRLSEDHYLMTTTTGGAAGVMMWLELWLQTEWPSMKVRLTSVTDHWATIVVAGPDSRKVLQEVCSDIRFSREAFPFMAYRNGTVADIRARVVRISFSGELAYEVNVPANHGQKVWDAIMNAGKKFAITPYGTEALHVLRAEKGFIIVGQDTDGSMTPDDLGMGGMVAKNKDFLGKRSLSRRDTAAPNRKQLVGLEHVAPNVVLPEGSAVLSQASSNTVLGHVTSSYMSPILGKSIAMGTVRNGLSMLGHSVTIALPDGGFTSARITSTVFYDKDGERQNVE
ncbi:sarcosine oxidase subunit alpha family protein [Caballeronia sp. DA-9]|uniref:sarcosine oxidase subunit alpha family protein n=1 Tax=Caballeronia sp. DA-9 TaxID=3436237 RepID=UPI003F66E85C